MPYLTRDGVKLYYEDTGGGEEAMLFVHGWTCNLSHFAPQVAHFAGRYRCVSVDLRGHGRSDAPEQGYGKTRDELAHAFASPFLFLAADCPTVS